MESGIIKTLFTSVEKDEALFPRTKTKAVSDDNGVGLDALLSQINAELDGKAPAGYGLGEAQFFSVANIDTITKPGWYYSNESATIGGFTGNRWWMIVKAYGTGATFATQEIHSFTSGTDYKLE